MVKWRIKLKLLKDMLRSCIIDFTVNWDRHLQLVGFAYNNSYHSSISMAPYEALYGRRCRSSIGWFEVGESSLLGPDLIYIIRNHLQTASSRQRSYADHRRRELEFEEGVKMYLKISPMKGMVRSIWVIVDRMT